MFKPHNCVFSACLSQVDSAPTEKVHRQMAKFSVIKSDRITERSKCFSWFQLIVQLLSLK